MTTTFKKIEKILFVTAITFLAFSASAFTVGDITIDDDSLYKYNALENHASFQNVIVLNTDNFPDTILIKNEELPVDVIKELQKITKKQNISLEKINIAEGVFKNRSLIRTFFIGNNLGTFKFQLVQVTDQIQLLESLISKTNDVKIQTQINSQTKSLKEEKIKVENLILEQDNKFSLFGWLVTSF